MNAMHAAEVTKSDAPTLRLAPTQKSGAAKVKLLMTMFNLSLRDICDGANRSISRSQLHRILHGQRPTPCERRAIALGMNECVRQRCDSAYLFGD